MRITRRFKKLIMDTDNASGDAVLVLLDEPDVTAKELMQAAYRFLETLPEFEGSVREIQRYLKRNVLFDEEDDYLDEDDEDEDYPEDDDDIYVHIEYDDDED